MKKPLIAYILRESNVSRKEYMKDEKEILELGGCEVIIGNSLDDIPENRIKDLDLLLAHLHSDSETDLKEQAKLKKLYGASFKFVAIIGMTRKHKSKDFGKLGNDYYMNLDFKNLDTNIADAVKYFLSDGKSTEQK